MSTQIISTVVTRSAFAALDTTLITATRVLKGNHFNKTSFYIKLSNIITATTLTITFVNRQSSSLNDFTGITNSKDPSPNVAISRTVTIPANGKLLIRYNTEATQQYVLKMKVNAGSAAATICAIGENIPERNTALNDIIVKAAQVESVETADQTTNTADTTFLTADAT